MGDVTLSICAAAIELGVPVVVAVLYWLRPQSCRKLAVVLGGVTRPLVVYGCIAMGLPIDPTDPSNRWAFTAVRRNGILGREPDNEMRLRDGDIVVTSGLPEALEHVEAVLLAG